MKDRRREVLLRNESGEFGTRYLSAYVDADGTLHIDGQDLGIGAQPVSSDGEYEWFRTISAEDVPRLVSLLGGAKQADVLDLLEESYSGDGSYRLEQILRSSDLPTHLSIWSG